MRARCSGSIDLGVCSVATTQWTRPPLPLEEAAPPVSPEPEHDVPPKNGRSIKPGGPPGGTDVGRVPLDEDRIAAFPFTIPVEKRTETVGGTEKTIVGVEGSEVYAAVRDHFAREAPGKSATSDIPGPTWSQTRHLPQTPPVRIVEASYPFDRWDTIRYHYGGLSAQVEGDWLEDYIQHPSTWPTEEDVLQAYLPEYVQRSREASELPPWGELVLEPLRGCWNLPRTNTDFLFWRGNTWGGAYMVLEHALRLIGAFYQYARDEESGYEPGASYHHWLRTLISGRNKHPTTGRLFATICTENTDYDKAKVTISRPPSSSFLTIHGAVTPYISLRAKDHRFSDAETEVVPGMDVCRKSQGFPKVFARPWDHAWYEPLRVEKTTVLDRIGGPLHHQFYWLPRGSYDRNLEHNLHPSEPWPSSRQRGWPEYWSTEIGNGGGVNASGEIRQLNLRAARLHFDGLVCDELLWWSGVMLRYSQDHPETTQSGRDLARFAFYRILQWSSDLLHELGHVYCNRGFAGHCLSVRLFMNHARGRFLCKVTKLLGLEPGSAWDPGYGFHTLAGTTTGSVTERRQTTTRYISSTLGDKGQVVACILRTDGGQDRSTRDVDSDSEYGPSYDPSWCRMRGPGQSLAEEGYNREQTEAALFARARFRMPECVSELEDDNPDASYTNPTERCEDDLVDPGSFSEGRFNQRPDWLEDAPPRERR